MSYNHNAGQAARWHKPAIIAIVIALLAAVIAAMVFAPMGGQREEPGGEAAPATQTQTPEASGSNPVPGGQDVGTTTTSTPATN